MKPFVKSLFALSGLVVAGFFLVIIVPYTIFIPIHTIGLYMFENRYSKIPQLPKSQTVHATSEVGLFGNSNHCDYIVGEFRISSSSRPEIEKYYKDFSVPALGMHRDPIPVEVGYPDDTYLFLGEDWLDWMERTHLSKAIIDHMYFVYILDGDYSPFGDYRCH